MKAALVALALIAAQPALALVAAPAPEAANPNAPPPVTNAPPAPAPTNDEPLPDPRLEADAQSLIAGLGKSATAETRADVRARLARGETPAMVRDAIAPQAATTAVGVTTRAQSRPRWVVPFLLVAACGVAALILLGRRKQKPAART